MDALAGYGSGSDDSGIAEQSASKQAVKQVDVEALDYDPSDAFGLGSLKGGSSTSTQTQSQAQAQSPPSKRKKKATAPEAAPASTSSIATPSTSTSTAVALAPEVIDNSSASEALLMRPGDTTMHVNIPYSDMIAPQLGPENPFASNSQRTIGAAQNTLTGHMESAAVSDFDFRNQQRTFHVYGYARDPSLVGSRGFVGDQNAAALLGGASAAEIRANNAAYRPATKALKKKRNAQNAGDPSVVEGEGAYVGPWAKWDGGSDIATQLLGADASVGPSQAEIAAAKAKAEAREREKEVAAKERKAAEEATKITETSILHGKSLYDYQGRTYMHIPTDVDVNLSSEPGEQESYLPKSCIHTFRGHSKGISSLKLFPRSGHLLLSCSHDTTVKLWDVYHKGNCLRTFMGHSKAVRDIAFSNDGRRFLSAGYDKEIKLWDTETGQCLDSFTSNKTPYCLTWHPDEDKQHIFLAGTSDKKILQYDINTHTMVQEYISHLGPINTITFVDNNRRFVTTSDDKTMRVWDYDIPVVIKYIADPTMHSMPAVGLSPSGKWLVGQSMDNQILTFASDGFKQNRNKVFKGHNVAGFACGVAFSPDGRFLSSGDGQGDVCFWDWKTTRLLKRLRAAHREAVIACAWLPHESSKVVTAGWDAEIKLWD